MYTNELNGMPTGHRRVSNRYCNTADGERSRQEQMLKNSDQIQSYPQQLINSGTIQDDNRIIKHVQGLETPSPKESFTEKNFLSQKVTNKSPMNFGQSHQSVFGNQNNPKVPVILHHASSSNLDEYKNPDKNEQTAGEGSGLLLNRVNAQNNTPPPQVNNSSKGIDLVKNIISHKIISNLRKTVDDEGNSFGSSNIIDASLVEVFKNQEFDIVKMGDTFQKRSELIQKTNSKHLIDNHQLTLGNQYSTEEIKQVQASQARTFDNSQFNVNQYSREQVVANETAPHASIDKNVLHNNQSMGLLNYNINKSENISAQNGNIFYNDRQKPQEKHNLLKSQSQPASTEQQLQAIESIQEKQQDPETATLGPLNQELMLNNVQFTNSQNSSKFYKSVIKEQLLPQQIVPSSSIQISLQPSCGPAILPRSFSTDVQPLDLYGNYQKGKITVDEQYAPKQKEKVKQAGGNPQTINYDSNSSNQGCGKKSIRNNSITNNLLNSASKGQSYNDQEQVELEGDKPDSTKQKKSVSKPRSNGLVMNLMNNSSVQKSRRLSEQHRKLIAFSKQQVSRPASLQSSGVKCHSHSQPKKIQSKRSYSVSFHDLIKNNERQSIQDKLQNRVPPIRLENVNKRYVTDKQIRTRQENRNVARMVPQISRPKRKSWTDMKVKNRFHLDLTNLHKQYSNRFDDKPRDNNGTLTSLRNKTVSRMHQRLSLSERKYRIASIVDRNIQNIKTSLKSNKSAKTQRKYFEDDDNMHGQQALSDTLTQSQMNAFMDSKQMGVSDAFPFRFSAKPSEILESRNADLFDRYKASNNRNSESKHVKSFDKGSSFEQISRNACQKIITEHSKTVADKPRALDHQQLLKSNAQSDLRNGPYKQTLQPQETPSQTNNRGGNAGKQSNVYKSTWIKKDSADSQKYIPVNDGLWESLKDDNFNQFFKVSRASQIQSDGQPVDEAKDGSNANKVQEISKFQAQMHNSSSVSAQKVNESSDRSSTSSLNQIDSDEELNVKNFSGKLSNYLICEDQHKKNQAAEEHYDFEKDYFINDMLKQIEAANQIQVPDDSRYPQILQRSDDIFLDQLFSGRMPNLEYLDDEHMRNMQLRHQPNDLQRISELQEEYNDNNTMKTSFSKSRQIIVHPEHENSIDDQIHLQDDSLENRISSQNQIPTVNDELSIKLENLTKNLVPREQGLKSGKDADDDSDAVNYAQSSNFKIIKLTSSESARYQGINTVQKQEDISPPSSDSKLQEPGANQNQCVTSEPAPLLTNEEDYCTVAEGIHSNENVNTNIDPLQILEPSSVMQDDTMQSNKDLLIFRNNSVRNSRVAFDDIHKFGGAANNLLMQQQHVPSAAYHSNLTAERKESLHPGLLSGNENVEETVPSDIQISLSHLYSARKGQLLQSPKSRPSEGGFTNLQNVSSQYVQQHFSSLNRQPQSVRQKRAPPSIMHFSNHRQQNYLDNQSQISVKENAHKKRGSIHSSSSLVIQAPLHRRYKSNAQSRR